MNKKTSSLDNGLIWFGAGVSIAEILTGTYYAELDSVQAILAILIGHLIGCFLLFLSGVIGGRRGLSAMESVKEDFGYTGGKIFAAINLVQLLGWTSIMIYDGALSAAKLFAKPPWLWALIVGLIIIIMLFIGVTNLRKFNFAMVILLFILTIKLCAGISGHAVTLEGGVSLSFGAAVELAIAMPLSWLPLISDYTKHAERPVCASAVSAGVYFAVSCWMYFIGMFAAKALGTSDLASIMISSGLGAAGLLIVILSTATTTFLDCWSAGVSANAILNKLSPKLVAIFITIAGVILAVVFPMDDITDFLYFLGSVFAPMVAIQIADDFILRKKASNKAFEFCNFSVWIAGFIAYRILMKFDFLLGCTLLDILLVILGTVIINKLIKSLNF